MILLALAKTERISDPSSINTQRTVIIFIRCLPSTTYFPEAKLSSTLLPSKFWKSSKTFHRQPENIQRLFRLQNCLSRKSPISQKFSKTFQQQQPAAISSSNQQQSAAAPSSSNQQQQPAAATRSSNQQQRPAETTSISNQLSSYQQHLHNQCRPPLVVTTVLSERYIPLAVRLGLVAR